MAEVPPGPSSVLSPQGDTLSPFPGGGGGAASSSSSTSSAAAAACIGAQDEEAEEEEEEEGPTGGREKQQRGGGSDGGKGGPQQHRLHHHHHHPPHHNHQLNGLISPELRHLRASLKSKILSSEAGAAPEGLENKRASKTMGSGQQQQSSPLTTAPCSSPLTNHLPPQGRTAPSPPPSPPAAAGEDRSQPAATTTTAAKTAAGNGLEGETGLEEEEQEEGDEGGEEEESPLLLSRSLAAACSLKGSGTDSQPEEDLTIRYVRYESELQMPDIMRLITKDLSEPYSIYTYRYFIHNWPQLCFLVVLETEITNKSALKLYENLGFVRDKRLFRYYLNGVDALRLKLWLR
ncbi:N-alpha-acetyltransferase 30 isoform X2 [Falco biarmicus]|uniref:N-alpha-acetyltransferase 30 isoform X3 n=1 Tax=Falco rusticolus TaxID=120794 RepID=UPI000679463D|nr:N-alpha-acetyltransferase 30 isoform X3 [Falco rusticolus]XP_040457266.1 N-alpha-acetyltransferase 30 isoform X2 [Falco naumanni]XP_055573217.1 N-alpha-acetyltransferase 30 isoform X2 [Falco cherrug]XP_055655738.1 N-alpha-acetyltransferase 30 isoform X2 [Falco peregrinus]XP_056202578.1 N-alpha-acetyltransferase 30 isoform X2 [Falco biarmicus]